MRHREDLVVRASGRQEKRRREAPRQAQQKVQRLRVVGYHLHALDYLGRGGYGRRRSLSCCCPCRARLGRLVLPPPPHRSKALLRQKEEGEKLEAGPNAALHKTSPHQGERPRPRRERRWLWPVAPALGLWRYFVAGARKKDENKILGSLVRIYGNMGYWTWRILLWPGGIGYSEAATPCSTSPITSVASGIVTGIELLIKMVKRRLLGRL